jgi:type IV secretory pathway VirB10-like protein
MTMRARNLVLLVCLGAATLSGCRRNIVRAAPPSVTSTPQPERMPQPIVVTPPPATIPDEPPEVELEATPIPAVGPVPRPRPPVEVEAAKPKAEPEPEPPQISPQLSAKAQAAAKSKTENDIPVAERNLQIASGRQLSAAQQDLMEKIRGFLAQAHEAVGADDWLRAQNLAHKALILSVELVRSL